LPTSRIPNHLSNTILYQGFHILAPPAEHRLGGIQGGIGDFGKLDLRRHAVSMSMPSRANDERITTARTFA
jgi:hypothetical protein